MKPLTIVLLFLIFCCPASLATQEMSLADMDNARLLEVLDGELSRREIYLERKTDRLSQLKNELARAVDDEQRYWVARSLYNEYRTFDSDSAMYYVDLSMNLARRAGRAKWVDEMSINRSYLYSATGLMEEARRSLEGIDPRELERSLYLQYNEQMLFLYTHRDQYLGTNSLENPYNDDSRELLENIIQEMPATDPQYCWFKGWHSLSDVDSSRQAISDILPIVRASTFETVDDAKNAWILSRLYERVRDRDNKLKYLILSAIADVRAYNKEIASLEEISSLMYRRRDLRRANDYIIYCLNCANEYKSRVRVGRLAHLQHRITVAYQEETERQARNLRLFFVALVVIVLMLLATLGVTYVQNRRLRYNKTALNAANDKLSRQVLEQQSLQEQLREANGKLTELYSTARQGTIELSENNYIKEKYIADIFAICSGYINKLDDFRRHIYRMLMARRYEEVKEMTKNQELSTAEIKELYRTFDKVFLGIYPDFVDDFNTLLRPDQQIRLKNGQELNTELRVFALVRLGLNDSTRIAQFLHCSVRTVYNTRQRVLTKAAIPREEFARRVRSLGKTAY